MSSRPEPEFISDILEAIIRNLEIIGEAVKNLSESFRIQYPAIPWRNIAGMRDKLIHDYLGVNIDIVWDVVKTGLPEFKKQLVKIQRQTWDATSMIK